MAKYNYYTMKMEELLELCKERKVKIDYDEKHDRKDLVEQLKMWDMENGKATDILVEGDNGFEAVDTTQSLVNVTFHNTKEDDPPYVPMGHNGKFYYVPKEQPVNIPRYILDSCIKDAVELHEEPYRDRNGKIQYRAKKVQRFPYSVNPVT